MNGDFTQDDVYKELKIDSLISKVVDVSSTYWRDIMQLYLLMDKQVQVKPIRWKAMSTQKVNFQSQLLIIIKNEKESRFERLKIYGIKLLKQENDFKSAVHFCNFTMKEYMIY